MKNAAVYAGLVASAFFNLGQATVNLTLVPAVNTVRIGEQVNLEWTTDQDYVRLTNSIISSRKLELEFVQKFDGGWSPAKYVFKNRRFKAGDGNYTFTIPKVEPNREYALWLSGENVSGSGGYANLTNWFVVESQYEDLK
ncbi:hypothetical protein D6D03_04131 [Aureobasidium pullulans]|nr:hypothetical protein D6D03_04131 [Aureobasidium pullulans]